MRCSAHTMGLSDSLGSFIAGVRPWTSRRVPPLHRWWANPGPPGSRARCFRACTGSATARDPDTSRDIDAPRWCLPLSLRRRRPGPCFFRGSIPSPHVPLSTLRGCPCGQPHMTRGRCGSLSLHRVTLAFTTPRRFIPALSGIYAERFCLYFSSLRVDLSTRSRRLGPCSLSRDDKSCSNPVAECVTDILRYDTSARSARHDSFPIGVVMTPDTVLIVIVLAVAATLQIAGLVYIANQNRK